ncbi:MAG: Deoxyribodipyrimidine photolyase (EC [uncultured Sulfurovum sp.]|uniref:Deoxyribodipyrimidine photolyase (EC) n=1 Tax=uncultured Sulfurovum sp. TaxID=269237 RepID=A0A6S6T8A6_9BACT|nr:MAG: Deoxyribodipyrimidine photolyase (EC [uncultured Sulfurovum sp.]
MKQILWFRRDLRIEDNAILAHAQGEVFPLFIFDQNILEKLDAKDKRVTFIYQSVLNLKKELQKIGLNLAIFYDKPEAVFQRLKEKFDEILCSIDHDNYAKVRDKNIEKIIPLKRFNDAFLIDPQEHLNKSHLPYKVFTPFYNSLFYLWESHKIKTLSPANNLQLHDFNYEHVPSLEAMGLKKQILPEFLEQKAEVLLEKFTSKLTAYQKERDFFSLDASTKLSVHLRFGLLSAKQFFNALRPYQASEAVIRQLFFREFYNYLLYHFPHSQFENQKPLKIKFLNNQEDFKKWCQGETGVPIVDAGMRHLNQTGLMHNRLRMVVSSYLTKNLLIDWRWGEAYFAKKLLDYEASSNIASWQWASSTGSDSVPYFRIFNPYLQSEKFDKEGIFIKSVLTELSQLDPKLFHKENGVQSNLFINYPSQIVSIKMSRLRAIEAFKQAKSKP